MTSTQLMEQICSSANLNQALRRVKKNKGCAGVDKLDITATIARRASVRIMTGSVRAGGRLSAADGGNPLLPPPRHERSARG